MIDELVKPQDMMMQSAREFTAMIEAELQKVVQSIAIDELMFVDGHLPSGIAALRHFQMTANGHPVFQRWLVRKADVEAYEAADDKAE